MRVVARYHRHRVVGIEHVPQEGRCLVVVNHSLATYDIGLLGLRIFQHTGRNLRGLGDRAIFRTPLLRHVATQLGVVEGAPDAAQHLLEANRMVLVAPGGMIEALRTTRERYQLMWERRRGFCRLAIATQSPIMLAACPRADDLYKVFGNRLTRKVYERLRLPAPLVTGMAGTVLPRPIPLTHHIAPLMIPPAVEGDEAITAALPDYHRKVVDRMERLMHEALNSPW
jgi:1-acyl-sn-glycerol-3-phosphate acyltransferase